MNEGRKCARCEALLTKQRRNQRKKYCGRCEPIVKRETKLRAHDRRIEKNGFTAEDYWLLFQAQGERCAIAGCKATGRTKFLAVEHDHKCTRGHDPKEWCRHCVRGLVCSMHNGWMGRANDSPEVFDSLAEYLRNPPAKKVLRT